MNQTDREITERIIRDVMRFKRYEWLDSENCFLVWQEENLLGISFEPLRDMNDAWMVVEKLRSKGYWVDIRDNKPIGWLVSFGQEMRAREETCSRAICMAALSVVEKINGQ